MHHHLKMLSNFNLVGLRHFSLNIGKNQKKNHYDCLGITPKATQGDIKNAYYKLSKEYHPDTNSGNASAAEKFRDIAEAYEILGNLKARKLYDRGITISGLTDNRESDEPVKEKYKHASFYHQRNKPQSTKSALAGKTRFYDMDEWTRSHYSETFTATFSRKREGRVFVEDKNQMVTENKYIAQVVAAIVLLMGFGFVYETDTTRKYDQVSNVDISDEKPN